jgi:hypothetical protein
MKKRISVGTDALMLFSIKLILKNCCMARFVGRHFLIVEYVTSLVNVMLPK